MIKLTEKQKATISQLNEQKIKIEQEYAALQQKISEILEFIFDANGVDTNDIDKVGVQDDHLVYTKKPLEAEPTQTVEEPTLASE